MAFLLHQLVSESARRRPEAPAVRHGDDELSYVALDRAANAVAHSLIGHGVQRGDRVGLHLPKSIDAVVSALGVLKAGACYVPLDVSNPPSRIAEIAEQCEMRCMLTDEPPSGSAVRCFSPAALRDAQAEWDPEIPVTDQDLAYILFTSGSTGSPKGVMLTHLNALTFVNWGRSRFGIVETDRLSNHAPLSFDLSVFDLFVAFAAGASVTLVPDGLARFPIRLAELIERERLTVWYSVPAILQMLLSHGRLQERDLSTLRLVLFAGEVFPVRQLRELMKAVPGPRYFNLYGPTETNVCTYCEVEQLDDDRVAPIPIGKPCENTDAFALTADGRLVTEPGEEGLLYVRGSTVMQGYYGRPSETAATFIENPFSPGRKERLYCTRDWVTLDQSGDFVFLGRTDNMVKTGGYRVELGEIEAALSDHPQVAEAAIVPMPDELLGNRIRAVVVPCWGSLLSEQEVRLHCRRRLPKYMVPHEVELRSALPRTATDKIDRTRLRQAALAG